MIDTELPEKIKAVVEQELEKIIEQYKPLGVLLVGSYSNGFPGDHSDVDIYIIVDDQDWRERGNYFIDGVEIEYFISPPRQIRFYFKDESKLRPHTAHMWTTGTVLYNDDPVIDKLMKEAREVIKDYPTLTDASIELYKYNLDDGRKDLLNAKDKELSLSYQLTAIRLFQQLIEIASLYHKSYMEKTTKLLDQLKRFDPKFADLVNIVTNNHYSWSTMQPLIEYVENNYLGGKRSDNWTLRGPLTV